MAATPEETLLEWRVWSKDGSGNPANMGDLTAVGADDYDVKLLNPSGGAGAVNVAKIDLNPSDASNYSNLTGARITGDLQGALFLQEAIGGDGGEAAGLNIGSDVEGPVTIPKVTGTVWIGRDVSQAVTIGQISSASFTINGNIVGDVTVTEQINAGFMAVKGNVPNGTTVDIADVTGASGLSFSVADWTSFDGYLYLRTGISDAATAVVIKTLGGTVDLTTGNVAGALTLGSGTASARIINGGAVSGTVTLAVDTGPGIVYAGSATFASVTSTGVVQTIGVGLANLQGPLTIVYYMDGLISIDGWLRQQNAEIEVGGTTRGDILISGNVLLAVGITLTGGLEGGTLTVEGHVFGPPNGWHVFTIADMVNDGGGNPSSVDFQQNFGGGLYLNSGIKASQEVRIGGEFTSVDSIVLYNQALAGTLEIVGGGNGSIYGVGAVSGTVILADGASKSYTGDAAFASVSGGGVIKTLNGADLGGDLRISGGVFGDVIVSGDVTSAGSVTVGGKLAAGFVGAGRVLVTGLCSGDISIGQETATATLIHLLGGLDSGASLVINDGEGNFNANGDIHVGLISCAVSPPDVTYDGCIRIYDEDTIGNDGDYGNLNGAIEICGCHATNDVLNICIDGADNGNVSISQTGCTNQVGWSCEGCP